MAEDPKAVLRIAGLVVIGLAPALLALVLAPGRGVAISAAGNAVVVVAFAAWSQRLVAESESLRRHDRALRRDLSALERTMQAQARELRDVRPYDVVTGVLKRAAFVLRLEETIARDGRLGKPAAFLLVDVEGFKAINSERGRLGGDAVLESVAHALGEATRGTDCLGRLGGDEFGVVLNECDDPGPVVDRIFQSLKTATGGDGRNAVCVAIGAVTIEGSAERVEVPELFRLAEDALASVRGTGGSLCARRTLREAADRRAASA